MTEYEIKRAYPFTVCQGLFCMTFVFFVDYTFGRKPCDFELLLVDSFCFLTTLLKVPLGFLLATMDCLRECIFYTHNVIQW